MLSFPVRWFVLMLFSLQLIQNFSARSLTEPKKSTPPKFLGLWLPISYRMYFKILLIAYKSLNSQKYISEMLEAYKPVPLELVN